MKAFQASILFSAAVLALTACHSNTYKISGAVEGLNDGDTLFITNDLQTGIPTDTLIVKDGKFELSGETDSTYLCMVYSEKCNELNAPFFIEPGNISIKLVETPGASRVGGTKCNEQWQELNDSVMTIGKEIKQHRQLTQAVRIKTELVSNDEEGLDSRRLSSIYKIYIDTYQNYAGPLLWGNNMFRWVSSEILGA